MGGLRVPDDAERYAEGKRYPRHCRCCGQKVWIVYHGPFANHTIEPRESSAVESKSDERGPTDGD